MFQLSLLYRNLMKLLGSDAGYQIPLIFLGTLPQWRLDREGGSLDPIAEKQNFNNAKIINKKAYTTFGANWNTAVLWAKDTRPGSGRDIYTFWCGEELRWGLREGSNRRE